MTTATQATPVPLDHPLGRRVGVFGVGGKTSLAKAIARKFDLEMIEIDWIQHMPDWVRRPEEDTERIVIDRMSANPNGWVVDHHPPNVRSLVYERGDSVVLLALPFKNFFWRRFKRSVQNAWSKELVCGGNRETFRHHFASRESAILEMWQKRHRYRRLVEDVSPEVPEGLSYYVIQTADELDRFYELQGLTR